MNVASGVTRIGVRLVELPRFSPIYVQMPISLMRRTNASLEHVPLHIPPALFMRKSDENTESFLFERKNQSDAGATADKSVPLSCPIRGHISRERHALTIQLIYRAFTKQS
jgi:hypothetical protein